MATRAAPRRATVSATLQQTSLNSRTRCICGQRSSSAIQWAVALRYAIDHPERSLGLVLVGTPPTMGATAAARDFLDSTVSKLTDPVDPKLVRGMTESALAQPVPRAFLDAAVQESMKVPAFVWKAAFESRWRLEGDYSAELGEITAPTLIVWGDQAARYARDEQEALASAIEGARLLGYHGAGHLLHWEEPQRFASDLATFVEGLSTRW